jgi:hypothetical protein
MLTQSTARYFAKQAYQLSVYNGLTQTHAKDRHGECLTIARGEGVYYVTDESGHCVTVKIAKAWL